MNGIVDRYRVRVAAAALAVAGILFVLYPATRPYADEKSLQGAQAFSSTAWVTSHAMGMLGFIGLAIGLLGVHFAQANARDIRRSFWALVITWIGAGLTLTYYGAEAYALRVIGRLARRRAGRLGRSPRRDRPVPVPAAVLLAASAARRARLAARGRLPVAGRRAVGPPSAGGGGCRSADDRGCVHD